MYINFLLLSVVICLLFLTPLKALAGDCWLGSLEVKVNEKIERQYQKKNETYKGSRNVDAEGYVMFSSGEGQLNITSKNISGYWSDTFFRDTGCVIHKGQTNGYLIDKTKIHAAYWKLNIDVQSTIRNIKGCMQDPIPPIKGSEEMEDFRFEAIANPGVAMAKMVTLCSSVKKTPELGFCKETPQGFYGVMIQRMGPLPDKNSRGEGSEYYQWYAEKVPCEEIRGSSSDDWALVPLNCKDPSAFGSCFRSQSRYCPGALERDGGPAACYSNAWDQCNRVFCQQ